VNVRTTHEGGRAVVQLEAVGQAAGQLAHHERAVEPFGNPPRAFLGLDWKAATPQ